jgi:hypothetical protein
METSPRAIGNPRGVAAGFSIGTVKQPGWPPFQKEWNLEKRVANREPQPPHGPRAP